MVDLLSLPNLPLEQVAHIPEIPAVYVALSETGEPLYVGRASCLRNRWRSHQRKLQLQAIGNVRIAWIESSDLPGLEAALIEQLSPSLNWTHLLPSKNGRVIRQVRMPLWLDKWLEEKAALSPEGKTVADKIREIVAAAYEAKQREQQAA